MAFTQAREENHNLSGTSDLDLHFRGVQPYTVVRTGVFFTVLFVLLKSGSQWSSSALSSEGDPLLFLGGVVLEPHFEPWNPCWGGGGSWCLLTTCVSQVLCPPLAYSMSAFHWSMCCHPGLNSQETEAQRGEREVTLRDGFSWEGSQRLARIFRSNMLLDVWLCLGIYL